MSFAVLFQEKLLDRVSFPRGVWVRCVHHITSHHITSHRITLHHDCTPLPTMGDDDDVDIPFLVTCGDDGDDEDEGRFSFSLELGKTEP